jgi:L-threonylcarbamoyladenylate synthase
METIKSKKRIKKCTSLVSAVTGGQNTVAVRMPSHPIALALLSAAKIPVAAPSANLSGRPSPTNCLHVLSDLQGRIDGIVDGGETCGIGLESTVLDCSSEQLSILRPGAVTAEQIEAVIHMPVSVFSASVTRNRNDVQVPRAPGMKYRHYAPKAPLDLVKGDVEQLSKKVGEWKQQGKKVGLLAVREFGAQITSADVFIACGENNCLSSYARELYRALRAFDDSPTTVDVIVVQAVEETGIGIAIMNRLSKAASSGFYMATNDSNEHSLHD